ncbi:hypothetical protein [Kribbella sp. NBC_00889]|uniref:hypothetical protein n=1 Tax=Kribbella sp. NBC_00889 TaxID=2975974 RepID=UPI00386BDD88|nr:hypothetical protein OG817_31465 [Kribbella sp. NBC_00889]
MPKVDASTFDTLRTWNGEQSRAFEELSFQLLKDQAPSGTRAIRTGNPDGGVEWYATLPDGTEWGWQAKHVKGIDALLTAMTGSVQRVAKERPDLRKLTFVISWNLATSKAPRRGKPIKSQREKYEGKVQTWTNTIPGADKIQFELVQESDLLDELAKPEHSGRRWFWWGDVVLGHDWLLAHHAQQASAAGEKYRPDLQVDVPIQEDLLALGFDRSVLARFDRLRRGIVSAAADVRLSTKDETLDPIYHAITDTSQALRSAAGALKLQAIDPSTALDALLAQAAPCRDAIYTAQEHERDREAARRELPDDDPKKAAKPDDRARTSYGLRTLVSAIDEMDSWLRSTAGKSFRSRVYFLTGQAGSGKTHLLLDATRRALDAGRPAVFLAGAQFGQGNLWASITDQLGLEHVGADVLLQAMDAAGEAAAMVGRRFVIFVDALNETTPPDFWRVHLPTLRAAVARYPHVALAVSCRDTYTDLVLEGNEGSHYVRRTHPGFAEREVEATQVYFKHYGLEAPKIPLLTPEFTLPLFLRLYCESLSETDVAAVPTGHQGRVAIFDRYLAAKISAGARRFRPASTSAYELEVAKSQVRGVLDALLDELSRVGRESISAGKAEKVARDALGGASGESTRVIALLQEEGVLTRERLYLGNGAFDEGVRIVFQAFSDFLLLKRRLAQSADPLNDDALKAWLANDCSWGIREAATIVFAEVYNIELPDLLGVKASDRPSPEADPDIWEQYSRDQQLFRSFVENLPYRDSGSIAQRTIELFNEAQRYFSRDEFYDVLFTLAPQPSNRLNAYGLHRYLARRPMPQRDHDFGFATYHALDNEFGPVARLARWAAAGPYPSYSPDVVELACIPLCWLMSSPNRFMRDWVTKALVQLLHGHLDVMQRLVERFWTVDDPYVVQRVVVIAYGSLLRSTPAQAIDAKALAGLVSTLVFTHPVRPDELLLDAAHGIVRWAVAHNLLTDAAAGSSNRPYGLKIPGPAPTDATIDTKYPWQADQPDDESYSSITFSLSSMGDFARYVIESGVRHFSRYRIGQDYPERKAREPRIIKSRWGRFEASLSEEQKAALTEFLAEPEETSSLDLLRPQKVTLTEEQWTLFRAAFVYPKQNPVSDEYPADSARRWVFRRTLSLGWTPQLFGQEDRRLGHGRGREEHKSERWGKKYQWMAYHELLARVADNYQTSRLYGEGDPYSGLHELTADREIDPSLPPIGFRAFSEDGGSGASAWGPPLIRLQEWPPGRLDFSRYKGDIREFVADTESEPSVATSALVCDSSSDDWVVLDSSIRQVDPVADKNWRGLQEHRALGTLLIPAEESETFIAALRDQPPHHVRDLVDSHGHVDCCYVGEVGRVGPDCPHRHFELESVTVSGAEFHVVPTIEQYRWEGNILDCSIGESARATLPSTYLQQTAMLTFDMRGPSWLDAAGLPIFTYYEEPDNEDHAFLVRASFLKEFLSQHKLELIFFHWFERMKITGDFRSRDPYIESSANARMTANLEILVTQTERTDRNQPEPDEDD